MKTVTARFVQIVETNAPLARSSGSHGAGMAKTSPANRRNAKKGCSYAPVAFGNEKSFSRRSSQKVSVMSDITPLGDMGLTRQRQPCGGSGQTGHSHTDCRKNMVARIRRISGIPQGRRKVSTI